MHRILLSAYLPLPEIVLSSDNLRGQLSFLGNRDELWKQFKECMDLRQNLETTTFIHDIGRLRWLLKGDMLGMAVHQARISNDYGMKHRMPIPLVAKRVYRVSFDSVEYHVVQEAHVFPSLYAEVKRKITSSRGVTIPPELIHSQREQFIHSLNEIKHNISKALFRARGVIHPSFSGCFRIDQVSSKKVNTNHSHYHLEFAQSNKPAIIRHHSQCSRLLLRRLNTAISSAFAQRVIVPVLWHTICDVGLSNKRAIREMIDCIFISHSPLHYIHSNRLLASLLPWSYQRRAFEKVAEKLGLLDTEKNLREEFTEWIQQFNANDLLFLMDCSEPLRSKLARTLKRLYQPSSTPELEPPTLNIFDYLVFAFLHDQILMEDDPQRHRIAEDRMGSRTAHQIHKGAQKLEGENPQRYSPAHEKSDLYPVPGTSLQVLRRMRLITTLTSKKTSATMTFRVNFDNDQVVHYCIKKRSEIERGKVCEWGE